MAEIVMFMKKRDCYGNILKMKDEMNELYKQSHINTYTRLSHN